MCVCVCVCVSVCVCECGERVCTSGAVERVRPECEELAISAENTVKSYPQSMGLNSRLIVMETRSSSRATISLEAMTFSRIIPLAGDGGTYAWKYISA